MKKIGSQLLVILLIGVSIGSGCTNKKERTRGKQAWLSIQNSADSIAPPFVFVWENNTEMWNDTLRLSNDRYETNLLPDSAGLVHLFDRKGKLLYTFWAEPSSQIHLIITPKQTTLAEGDSINQLIFGHYKATDSLYHIADHRFRRVDSLIAAHNFKTAATLLNDSTGQAIDSLIQNQINRFVADHSKHPIAWIAPARYFATQRFPKYNQHWIEQMDSNIRIYEPYQSIARQFDQFPTDRARQKISTTNWVSNNRKPAKLKPNRRRKEILFWNYTDTLSIATLQHIFAERAKKSTPKDSIEFFALCIGESFTDWEQSKLNLPKQVTSYFEQTGTTEEKIRRLSIPYTPYIVTCDSLFIHLAK